MNKLLIITAPSGAGKTTIVKHLLKTFPNTLAFSVSATTRAQRPNEVNGVDYYFINIAEFLTKRENDEFVEWQEVYENQFYGTLKKEVDRLWEAGKTVLFDIDVKGAMNIKKAYPEQSLSIFVQPPSYELLEQRLKRRNTESEESLKKRLEKVKIELTYANCFDKILVNDILENSLKEAEDLVRQFLNIK